MDLIAAVNAARVFVGAEPPGMMAASPPRGAVPLGFGVESASQARAWAQDMVLEDNTRRPSILLRPGRAPNTVVRVGFDIPAGSRDTVFRALVGTPHR